MELETVFSSSKFGAPALGTRRCHNLSVRQV
jgi:hypothetical protein